MEKRNAQTKITKWLTLFLIVFAISLPVTSQFVLASGNTYSVVVSKGYLALRNAKGYDYNNEIGELYTGDVVKVTDYSDETYWYVYSPKYDTYGYVNKNYLITTRGSSWTVKVDKGYLALRTEQAYDAGNEIGELYTGDRVRVYEPNDSDYWYVYSPKHKKYGYVNKSYLFNGSVSDINELRSVHVETGYLALRSEKAYDAGNETGSLYNGDIVQILDDRDSTYWYVYSPKYGRSGYVNKNYLVDDVYTETKSVQVNSGYLALRCARAYDVDNEIGELYAGELVEVLDKSHSDYWYVYSETLGKCGYVNCNYLVDVVEEVYVEDYAWDERTVYVSSGYLAIREEPAYDAANELGELYSGDVVQILGGDDAQYWYVYAPSLDMYGYVNKDYLF